MTELSKVRARCIFCDIAQGSAPSHKIHEDELHIAFLNAFPIVKGQTVVITKRHYPGYHFAMPKEAYKGLMSFVQDTAGILDRGLGADRTLMVAQGYEIDHAHIKLFPVIKVNARAPDDETYRALKELTDGKWYGGYMISHSGRERADDRDLDEIVRAIKKGSGIKGARLMPR